jgi:hypothetical protein
MKKVKRMLDIDDLPPGTWVRTPCGKVGTVIKSRGAESRLDYFQRVVVYFGGGARDTVVLQPHLLVKLDKHPAHAGDDLKII